MKNMYMTPLNYENFNGAKKSTKLHFHVTPREFVDWMLEHPDTAAEFQREFEGVQDAIEGQPGEATQGQIRTMLRFVKVLAEIGYGEPSDDGEYFDKSQTAKFAHSAAYEGFRLFLFEKPKELSTFISTLLNEDVLNEFSATMQSGTAEMQELPQPAENGGGNSPTVKDVDSMTPEELREALRNRG